MSFSVLYYSYCKPSKKFWGETARLRWHKDLNINGPMNKILNIINSQNKCHEVVSKYQLHFIYPSYGALL